MEFILNYAWCPECKVNIRDPYPAIIKRELFPCCYVATPGCRRHGILKQHVPVIISTRLHHHLDDGSRLAFYDLVIDNLGNKTYYANEEFDDYEYSE